MKVTEQTLLEQMQMTDHEMSRRKQLLGLGSEESALLGNCKALIEREIDTVIEAFYSIQVSDEDVTAVLGGAEAVRRLHGTQRQYVLDLFSGNVDNAYVNNRLRIGMVHKRFGVEPKLYLSAVRVLKDLLDAVLDRYLQGEVLARTRVALDKLLYFDITLVFDTYTRSLLTEVESARERAEDYAESLEVQVAERTRQLEEKVCELEAALALVKKLQGVIPICGICKKIRDDKESWQQLEKYISEHSEALFSHGLCPDCYEKELQEIRAMKDQKSRRNEAEDL